MNVSMKYAKEKKGGEGKWAQVRDMGTTLARNLGFLALQNQGGEMDELRPRGKLGLSAGSDRAGLQQESCSHSPAAGQEMLSKAVSQMSLGPPPRERSALSTGFQADPFFFQ